MSLRTISLLALALAPACAEEPDVTIYCALDQVHSEPLLRRFEAETGLRVRMEFDVEAHKTVGLVERIRAERARPRCDVFWNNEIANTVALADEGLLASYDSPSAADIPESFRDPQRRWTGFAARARVFIVNTDLVPDPSVLTGMQDLLAPRWAGRVVMAAPLTGTTLTHFAALWDVLGEEAVLDYLESARDAGVHIVKGNGHVMRLVRDGQMAWGWTDTDDYNVAREGGYPVTVVYPDQGGLGTMVIPNTVAILADAPHPKAARRLVDWILSEDVEAELAAGRSAQIPVRASVPHPATVRSLDEFDVMKVDFTATGKEIGARLERFKEIFTE